MSNLLDRFLIFYVNNIFVAREGGFGDNANNAQTVGVGQTTQGNQFGSYFLLKTKYIVNQLLK